MASVPAELESALQLNTAQNYITKRPWLDRYGINVRPIAPIGSSSRKVKVDSSILQRCLPDELLFELSGVVENHEYDTSWRKMWLLRPRVRTVGTITGANNRMDLLSLVTSGVNNKEVSGPDEDIPGVVEGWQDDETHNPDAPAVSHKRGLTPFVFAPFEEVEASFLNLPAEKMDYFVPG